MTLSEFRTDIRRRLGETATVFYSDDDIDDAIDEAYEEMADATEFYERQAQIQAIAGHTYYNLLNILPDTFLSPRRIYDSTTSRWLTPTDPRELDYHGYRQWERVSGPPQKYLMRGNWWLGVFPRPATDLPIERLSYTAIPSAMSATTDEPAFPREYHPGISEFALSDLFSQARETVKALDKWADYLEYEIALKSYVEGRANLAGAHVL